MWILFEKRKTEKCGERRIVGLLPVSLVIIEWWIEMVWMYGTQKMTLCMINFCTVKESLQLSGRVCLSHSAAHAIYASWLQTLSSAAATTSDVVADNL